MALFKPFRGTRTTLNAQELHDGHAYFCTDDGSFHIDYVDADGNLQRKQINAKDAETLGLFTPNEFLLKAELLQSDWNQTDESQKDFIKNKPEVLTTSGGTVNGNLTITGDLAVNGTTISEDHQTLLVEDNMAILNSNKANLQTALSGIAINKNDSSTYGVVYDPTDDTFKFGAGTVDENNDFHFSANEGLPFAVRDDSSKFTDNHTVVWSSEGNKFVDSGHGPYSQADWNQTNTSSPSFIRNKPNTLTSLEHAVGKRVSGIDANGQTTYGEIFNDYDLNKISGAYAFACGTGTQAGTYSHACGYNNKATGTAASAEGYNNMATGWASHVEGEKSKATGSKSHAEGAETFAGGACSHAEGYLTQTTQSGAHAEGYKTYSSGWYSHAEGQETTAQGNHSHTEGIHTVAFAEDCHAEGYQTAAIGYYSHAEGYGLTSKHTLTGAANATVYTIDTIPEFLRKGNLVKYIDGAGVIVLARITAINIETNQITVSKTLSATAITDATVTIYVYGVAMGYYSHAEGYACVAEESCCHAEGYKTEALIGYSHSEGNLTIAGNWEAHAEGKMTNAMGKQSHAEGLETSASGTAAHVGGYLSHANNDYSFAHGQGVITDRRSQTVVGEFNAVTNQALFVVGGGTSDTDRKNAFEVINNDNGAAIKVGNTIITEDQLNRLLALL